MKVITSTENIKSLGGLNFISNEFNALHLPSLITEILGSRSIYCTYQYSDVIKSLWFLFFSGGDCAEDIQENLRDEFLSVDNLLVPSADTVLRVQQELSTEKKIVLSKNKVENEINTHSKLNDLNIKMLIKTSQLIHGGCYDLDFDNQFIECEKYDAKKGYKMVHGYFPGVASIGKNIVYLENRNGNSNVKFEQENTLENVFNLLAKNKISINRSRMDCGSFTQKVIEKVEKHSKQFYIRAQKCGELSKQLKKVTNWQTTVIGFKKVQTTSIEYKPFGQEKIYRYVVSRETNKTGQTDIETGDNFIYRAIITNDKNWSDQEVIEFYNQRGASETNFDELNNDFGWANLPFSFLEENTVFMLIMAMCRNFYLYLVNKFAQKLPFLKSTFRLKKFIFRFVVVPYKWIKVGGQKTLKLFTDKPYRQILT